MADGNGGEARSGIAKALGLRGKGVTSALLPPITDEELHDEAVIQAISGTRAMRKDLAEWKSKAEHAAAEFSGFRHDAAQELLTQKHEYESKIAMLRAKIEAQDHMLKDVGRKMEHYERLSFELGTKCEDIEKFYMHELHNIRDAANHMAIGLVANINNATISLNEAAKHGGNGLVKQVESSASNMTVFIQDLRNRRGTGEFRPKKNDMAKPPAEEVEESLLTAEQEDELKSLAARLAPKRDSDDE